MAKKRKNLGVWGRRLDPVDGLAARVANERDKPVDEGDPKRLRKKATQASDPQQKTALLKKAREAERALKRRAAAKKAAKTRLVGSAAETRARKELEAARWRRDNSRD